MAQELIGHNSQGIRFSVEVRLFNSLARFGGANGPVQRIELAAGSTVNDIVRLLGLPLSEVFLVLRNGRDVSPGLYERGNINTEAYVDAEDVIAFSGPVPYSFGYGAPVV
jgi:Mut7-C ubiquitin